MPRPQKEPLRALTPAERAHLEQLSRSQTQPAARVARAKALLAVATGHRFTVAARAAGRRSGDAVAQLVARFNHTGLAALDAEHGGGQPKRYTTLVWGGQRTARRDPAWHRRHRVGGSGACTGQPLRRPRTARTYGYEQLK
jgi:Helix-turn-helix domain